MIDWKKYDIRLQAVSAYRSTLRLPPMRALTRLVSALAQGRERHLISTYADVFYRLQEAGHDSLGGYLWEHLCYDETPYGDAASRGVENAALADAARRDIATFSALCALTGEQWLEAVGNVVGTEMLHWLPQWRSDDTLKFDALTERYRRDGAGEFSRYKAFLWDGAELTPVADPDLESYDLIGYEEERRAVWENTRALLEGHSVNNILLYGAAGTGKSATVKSLLKEPEFGDLRIIELNKQRLDRIPALIRRLTHLRQKFVLFIDDLSFESADSGYSVLKTVLEGSIEKRPSNVVIYATSNRRHLMRETFSERGDDEVNRRESISERTALSERFGIRVLFRALNKTQYLEMVHAMAQHEGIDRKAEELERQALQWEREHACRTPRSARQFIRYLSGTGSR